MRPLELRLQAFGPYLEPQAIDFRPLTGIFLICGETGAGKTMLLDALCFCLYGRSSGGGRDRLEQLRSQSAPDETPTQLSLLFSHRGREYLFTRELLLRRKRNGAVEFRTVQNALRREADGGLLPLLANPTAQRVNEQAVEILGLDCEQFCRVVLLPQGKFERFLLAKSGEKEEILQSLFDVGPLLRLTERLFAMAKEKEASARGLEESLARCLDRYQADTPQALRQDLERQRETLAALGEALGQAGRRDAKAREALARANALLDSFRRREAVRAELQALAGQQADRERDRLRLRQGLAAGQARPALVQAMEARSALLERKEARSRAEAGLEEARLLAENARRRLSQQEAGLSEQRARQAALGRLRALLPDYRGLQAARERLSRANAAAAGAERGLRQADEAAQRAQETLEQARQERDRLQADYVSPMEALRKRRDDAQAQAQAQVAAAKAQQDLARREQDLASALEGQRAAARALTGALEEQQAQLDLYLSNAAAALASCLQEGKPCPVCGSRAHPQPHGAGGPNNQAALRAAQAALRQAQAGAAEAEKALSAAQLGLEAAKQARQSAQEALTALPVFTPAQREQAFSAYARAQEGQRAHEALLRSLPQLEAAWTHAKGERERAAQSQADARREQALAGEALGSLERRLDPDLPDEASLHEKLQALEADSAHFDQALERLRSEAGVAEAAVEAGQRELALAQKEQAAAANALSAAEERLQAALISSGFADEQALSAALLSEAETQALQQALGQYDVALELRRDELRRLEEALQGQDRPALDALEEEQAEAGRELERLRAEEADLRARVELLQEDVARAEGLSLSLEEAQRLYHKLDRFARTVRGDRGVGLTRYALHAMLLTVCERANELLRAVHAGRYALSPSLEGDGRGKAGLDLTVLDAFSGKSRGVESLSGGEKFLVSLALSIALKTVAQGLAGGAAMESMFVDEGFGSLDASSVQDALQLLLLSGGKEPCIGIISHVQALQETLGSRIRVLSKAGRSRAMVEA